MHPSALHNGDRFFQTYGPFVPRGSGVRLIDIGARDVNGSLRQVAPPTWEYIGIDFASGAGVDVVLSDPYVLPFADASVDVAVSSSCFEHAEMFWLLHLEVLRVLKPHGLFYLNAPSNGSFHRYPVDCWRFYPDSGHALAKWARRNHMPSQLLESFVSHQVVNPWNDFVAVFVRDDTYAPLYPKRMLRRQNRHRKRPFVLDGWPVAAHRGDGRPATTCGSAQGTHRLIRRIDLIPIF